MESFKKDLILIAAKDISSYVSDTFGADVDFVDIMEIINYNIGKYIITDDGDDIDLEFEEDENYE